MTKQKADEIITEYLPKIYGFSVKKSFLYDEAEELCSDITEAVYLSLLKTDEVYNLNAYVWRICEHTYSKYLSSKKKHQGVSIDGMDIPFEQEFLPDDTEEELRRLRREIAFLTKTRREIIYDFYYLGKQISLISEERGLPVGTVKWHLHKARGELKKGFEMERNIGKLGIAPVVAVDMGHSGFTGNNSGTEFYLGDKLNLNIVYSVYHEPKTLEEIAEELGVTPVYIEDRVEFLEDNGFLVRKAGDKFTTFVEFSPQTFSREAEEARLDRANSVAEALVKDYVPAVLDALKDFTDVYIPGGNRELFYSTMLFVAISNRFHCHDAKIDLSRYTIRTMAGGEFTAHVYLDAKVVDPEFEGDLINRDYIHCGQMGRLSEKYPSVHSWSVDSRFDSRTGGWKNNITSDFEYLYEYINGEITDRPADKEKMDRLRERKYIGDDGRVNIMIAMDKRERPIETPPVSNKLFDMLPRPTEELDRLCADAMLESAMIRAKDYPPHMRDYIIANGGFSNSGVAMMVLDILYKNGTFRPLTENEKVTANLIMFSDVLPE